MSLLERKNKVEVYGKTLNKVVVNSIDELRAEVNKELEKGDVNNKSRHIDLNYIDVSRITNMALLFHGVDCNNIDISKWDVSKVETMSCMFSNSKFNGDISSWDVSSVKDMSLMFYNSDFSGDLSNWNVSSVIGRHGFCTGVKLGKIKLPNFVETGKRFLV